ncbi:MAG: hypothetical protein ACFB0B_21940 [Thermonemataceae bacterium]
MKHTLLIALIIFITTFTSTGVFAQENYEGVIGKDKKIALSITAEVMLAGNNMSYSGSFYPLTDQEKKSFIKGKINMETGRFSFIERDEKGQVKGYLVGTQSGNQVDGHWKSVDKKEELPFKLQRKP